MINTEKGTEQNKAAVSRTKTASPTWVLQNILHQHSHHLRQIVDYRWVLIQNIWLDSVWRTGYVICPKSLQYKTAASLLTVESCPSGICLAHMHVWKKSCVLVPKSDQGNVDLKSVLLCSGPSTLEHSSGRAMPCTVFTGIVQDKEICII